MALVDLDVTAINVPATVGWYRKQMGQDKEALPDEQFAFISQFIDSLKKAGAEHVYIAGSTR